MSNKDNTVNIELLSRVDKDRVSIGALCLCFLDFALVAIIMFSLSSKFIVSSGVAIAFNSEETQLPVSMNTQPKGILTTHELCVLHIQSENMILFEGSIYNMANFSSSLKLRGDLNDKVLLIKINKDCDIQTFLNICEVAQGAGFKAVQIAAQKAQ